MAEHTTIDPADRDRFDALGEEWWSADGPMKPLHLFTPVRIKFLLAALRDAGLASGPADAPLTGVSILDIGCGGGLLCEPLARLGGTITGIDASGAAINAASNHAEASGLDITYLNQPSEILAETVAETGAYFDFVYSSEVIEHVSDQRLFLQAMASLLRPGGGFALTTINRSLPALAFAKFAMEYVVKIIPKGTHDYRKFVRPDELRRLCDDVGLSVEQTSGFVPLPTGGFTIAPVTAINYGVRGTKR